MEMEDYGESARTFDAIEKNAAIEAAGTKIFERLYQLVQRGYRPDFHMQFPGAIWLHHPAKNFKHGLVYLYPDGCVKSAGATDEYRFDLDEDLQFQKFLRSVPQPTFWDRTREWR